MEVGLIFLFLLMVGGVMFFVLRKMFTSNLSQGLSRLNSLVEENLIKESQLREELERAKQERAGEVRKGREEAEKIIETARKEAEVIRKKIEEEAKLKAEKILAQGKEELEKLKVGLDRHIKEEAVRLGAQMIEGILTSLEKETVHRQFIQEALRNIKDLEKEKFCSFSDKIKVISSLPLIDSERQQLKSILESKLEREISFTEEVRDQLIIGIILEIGKLVVDCSLKNRLEKAVSLIKEMKD